LNVKCVFFFFTNLSGTFLILRRIQRVTITNVQYMGLNVKYSYSCQSLMELVFARQIFDKYPNSRSHKDPPNGNQIVHAEIRMDKQTFRHVEVDSRFSQFCKRVETLISYKYVTWLSSCFLSSFMLQWYMPYTIAVCTVKKTPGDVQRNCPKHVEF